MATPVYYYWDLGRLGRGEVLRLFLRDAGIDVKEFRYPYDDNRPATGQKLISQGVGKTGLLPALEWKGEILTQHIPTLRFLSRELGSYDGDTSKEKYLVDALSDIYIDWRSQWVAQLSEKTDEYKSAYVPKYHSLLEHYYSINEGPYLLGDKITYVDFAVYQSIDNDERIQTAPAKLSVRLQKFRETFEARPNISAYIKENAIQ